MSFKKVAGRYFAGSMSTNQSSALSGGGGPAVHVSLDEDTIARAFPIGSETHVATMLKELETTYTRRHEVASKLLDKLNEERPHDPVALRRAGMAWRSNFTTRPLNTLVGRVIGRLTNAVERSRYLTTAQLPKSVEDYRRKSELFQGEITSFVRGDPRWSDLVQDLATQTALFGSDVAIWLSEDEWLPESGGQKVFLPANTRTVAREANVVVLKWPHPPHEVFAMLTKALAVTPPDQPPAEAAQTSAEDAELPGDDVRPAKPRLVGDPRWNLEELVEAINGALPSTLASQQAGSAGGEVQLMISEMRRSLMSYSTATADKVVTLYHIFVREITGKVTYLIYDSGHRELFRHEDYKEGMEQLVAFFSFERPANKTMAASKGVGRIAYAMASVLDRARNDTVDRLQMGGKVLIQGPENQLARFRMHVIGGAMVIGSDWQPVQQIKLETNIEESIALDNYLRALLDDMSGSVSPKVIQGERVTAAQINLLAGREDERSDEIVLRFLSHLGRMMTQIQMRIFKSNDPRVDDMKQRLLQAMPIEELEMLIRQPAVSTVMAYTEAERQAIVAACVEGRNNPMYDQYAVEREKLAAQVGPDLADRLLLPQNDPTMVAEQTRMQLLESDLLLNGQDVPVSPRDNHEIHLQAMVPLLQQLGGALSTAPDGPGLFAVASAHAMQHAQMLQASGKPLSPELQQMITTLQQAQQALQTLPPEEEETPAPVGETPVGGDMQPEATVPPQ